MWLKQTRDGLSKLRWPFQFNGSYWHSLKKEPNQKWECLNWLLSDTVLSAGEFDFHSQAKQATRTRWSKLNPNHCSPHKSCMFIKQSYWSTLCFLGNDVCVNIYASLSVYVSTVASICMHVYTIACIICTFGMACLCVYVCECMCVFQELSVLKRGCTAVMQWHLSFAAVLWSGAEGRGQATLTETLWLRAHHVWLPASLHTL